MQIEDNSLCFGTSMWMQEQAWEEHMFPWWSNSDSVQWLRAANWKQSEVVWHAWRPCCDTMPEINSQSFSSQYVQNNSHCKGLKEREAMGGEEVQKRKGKDRAYVINSVRVSKWKEESETENCAAKLFNAEVDFLLICKGVSLQATTHIRCLSRPVAITHRAQLDSTYF